MFIHGMTGKVYHSVREKINYFRKRVNDKTLTDGQREYAQRRLSELSPINAQSYSEPKLVVTDDKVFGDPIHKPRLCVVIDEDDKNRVLVSPIIERTTKSIILDGDHDRQIGERRKWIDRNDIYENKYIYGVQPLTHNDRSKIKKILRKK